MVINGICSVLSAGDLAFENSRLLRSRPDWRRRTAVFAGYWRLGPKNVGRPADMRNKDRHVFSVMQSEQIASVNETVSSFLSRR